MARGGISDRERGRRASSEATGGRAPFGSARKTTANHVLISWRVMMKLQELWQSKLQMLLPNVEVTSGIDMSR